MNNHEGRQIADSRPLPEPTLTLEQLRQMEREAEIGYPSQERILRAVRELIEIREDYDKLVTKKLVWAEKYARLRKAAEHASTFVPHTTGCPGCEALRAALAEDSETARGGGR
jgi:hypothetical protein